MIGFANFAKRELNAAKERLWLRGSCPDLELSASGTWGLATPRSGHSLVVGFPRKLLPRSMLELIFCTVLGLKGALVKRVDLDNGDLNSELPTCWGLLG